MLRENPPTGPKLKDPHLIKPRTGYVSGQYISHEFGGRIVRGRSDLPVPLDLATGEEPAPGRGEDKGPSPGVHTYG